MEEIKKARDALYEEIGTIDSFVKENPNNFSKGDLDIVLGWKNFVKVLSKLSNST